MRARPFAVAALLAPLALLTPALGQDEPPAAVPGPLRPLPAGPVDPTPVRRPVVAPRTVAPPRAAARAWVGRLAPTAKGELANGAVRLDLVAHRVEIADFAVTDAPDLEIALVAADRILTTADVLASKRVSLGRLKRIRAKISLRFPAEMDPAVYRTLVVWSRRDRAPRGVARLAPDRAG